MKKMIQGLMALLVLAGCSIEKDLNMSDKSVIDGPTTEVYVAGTKVTSYTDTDVKSLLTRGGAPETYDNAYFFIRIDNRIPEMTGSVPVNKLYPKLKNGNKNRYCALNKGSVLKNFAYKNYGKAGIEEYVYDPSGQVTSQALVDVPTLDDLLQADLSSSLPQYFQNVDKSKVKIIWYVVENKTNVTEPQQGIKHGAWLINGVVTMDTVTDVRTIPDMEFEEEGSMEASEPDTGGEGSGGEGSGGEGSGGEGSGGEGSGGDGAEIEGTVKVDIHQQEHKDWESIKTTIHIGALVDSVKVSFPIAKEFIAEQDDFAIRTYDAYYPINYIQFNLKVQVAHEDDQVVITVKNIAPDVINAEKLNNQDGLTVEVWSYVRQAFEAEDPTTYRQSIYQKLQQAQVKVGLDQPNYSPDKDTPARDGKMYTQISSAFF